MSVAEGCVHCPLGLVGVNEVWFCNNVNVKGGGEFRGVVMDHGCVVKYRCSGTQIYVGVSGRRMSV